MVVSVFSFFFSLLTAVWYDSLRCFSAMCRASWAFSVGVLGVVVWGGELTILFGGVGEVFVGAGAVFGAVIFGAGAKSGRVIGVPAMGGGGVRVSCLMGVKTVVVVLLSLLVGFLVVLALVWEGAGAMLLWPLAL